MRGEGKLLEGKYTEPSEEGEVGVGGQSGQVRDVSSSTATGTAGRRSSEEAE